MARIVIYPFRERGHTYPTFKLAKQLTLFHEVEYLVTPDWAPYVRANGFRTSTFMDEIFPAAPNGMAAAVTREKRMRYFLEGRFERTLAAQKPDLLVCDWAQYSGLMVAQTLGIPTVRFCTSLFHGRVDGIPPLESHSLDISPAAVDHAWNNLFNAREAVAKRDPYMGSYYEYIASMNKKYPCPRHALSWQSSIIPDFVGLPTLVAAPSAFEFYSAKVLPANVHMDVACLAETVDNLAPDLAEWIAADIGPIIGCALGSNVDHRPRYRALYDTVLSVARDSELRFVIAAGESLAATLNATDNVFVTPFVAQQALLPSLTAMITVGGLGTLKECFFHGVPVIVVPYDDGGDTPGNAARVTYHDCGIRIQVEQCDRNSLSRAIQALVDKDTCSGLPRLTEATRRAEQGKVGVERINSVLHTYV